MFKLDQKSKVNRFELVDALENSRFKVKDEQKIIALLEEIKKKRAFLSAYDLNTGQEFLTVIFDIDVPNRRLIFDAPDAFLRRRKEEDGKLMMLTTSINRVRIQFKLTDIANDEDTGSLALTASFPAEIIRLQRREFYRLVVEDNFPEQSTAGFRRPFCSTVDQKFDIYDISVGGLGINNFPDHHAGDTIQGLHIFLSDDEIIVADMVICHTFCIHKPVGDDQYRTGCKFSKSSVVRDRQIQRYINEISILKETVTKEQEKLAEKSFGLTA